jgi:cytochrome c-type biogenesis protein CcmH/NrfG
METTNPNDIANRQARKWLRACLGFALAFGLTWALPAFFNWTLLAAALFSLTMYWLKQPRAAKPSPGPTFRQRPSQPAAAPAGPEMVVKRVIVLVALSMFGLFVLLMLIGLFASDDTAETTTVDPVAGEYRDALEANPNDLDALTNVGNRFFENNQYDSALAYYDRVLEIEPQNAAALYNKGLIYYNQQQYEKSVELLNQCIRANPDYTDAYLIQGHNYYDRQRLDEALTWYNRAYERGMQNAFLSHVLAYIYDTKGNLARALPLYKEALQLDSTRVDIYPRLAELEPTQAARYNALAERWKNN